LIEAALNLTARVQRRRFSHRARSFSESFRSRAWDQQLSTGPTIFTSSHSLDIYTFFPKARITEHLAPRAVPVYDIYDRSLNVSTQMNHSDFCRPRYGSSQPLLLLFHGHTLHN
jgi:hypothetical protein